MKNKLFMLTTIVALFFAVSCSQSNPNQNCEQLKKENDSLRKIATLTDSLLRLVDAANFGFSKTFDDSVAGDTLKKSKLISDELIAIIGKFSKLKDAKREAPIDDAQAEPAVAVFHAMGASSTIKIPAAFLFKKYELAQLINKETNKYIRFYSSIRPNTSNQFTLIAVGVNANNQDDRSQMFEFANPCPPCNFDGETLDIPQPPHSYIPAGTPAFYTFKKQ